MRNMVVIPPDFKKKVFKQIAYRCLACLFLLGTLALPNCGSYYTEESEEMRNSTALALAWNGLALELERHTLGYRPPVSGRMFAYVEMAAYEASLPGLRDFNSLGTFVSGYTAPPASFNEGEFYLPASLNAAYAEILRDFFSSAPDNLHQQIEALEKKYAQDFLSKTNPVTAIKSADFGKTVAKTVWAWSKTDREGHEGNLYNYDHGYTPPECKGCWSPTGAQRTPALLPYWGRVRPFVVSPSELDVKSPIEYSELPGSDFYTEAMEVYAVSKPLSKENRWVAEFWSDDLPGLTLTPVGRWMSIANQSFEKSQAPFTTVIEAYLKIGLALCDAGVSVWHAKYKYNIERPETYIKANIQADWQSLHDTPSFPAYPSGHAAFGAAASEVLTDALGSKFQLTDRTHEKRPEFASTPRSYGSFAEMAQENAASRVLLGVHYRMDCEEGLRLGKIIGRKVVNLPLRRKEAAMLRK